MARAELPRLRGRNHAEHDAARRARAFSRVGALRRRAAHRVGSRRARPYGGVSGRRTVADSRYLRRPPVYGGPLRRCRRPCARAGVRRGAGLGRRAGLADGGVARRVHGMGEPQRRSDAAARWVRHPGVERRLRGAGDAASQATVCGSAIPPRGRAFGIRRRIIPEFFEQSFGMELVIARFIPFSCRNTVVVYF